MSVICHYYQQILWKKFMDHIILERQKAGNLFLRDLKIVVAASNWSLKNGKAFQASLTSLISSNKNYAYSQSQKVIIDEYLMQ